MWDDTVEKSEIAHRECRRRTSAACECCTRLGCQTFDVTTRQKNGGKTRPINSGRRFHLPLKSNRRDRRSQSEQRPILSHSISDAFSAAGLAKAGLQLMSEANAVSTRYRDRKPRIFARGARPPVAIGWSSR